MAKIYKLNKFIDNRGFLLKVVENAFIGRAMFGELYMISFKNKQIRGNHYHKKTTEWFVVIKGNLRLILQHSRTKKKEVILLSSDDPRCVRIDPLIAHSLEPVDGRQTLMLAYSSKKYNALSPDTYKYVVK